MSKWHKPKVHRCSRKSRVFVLFLKTDRDSADRTELGNSFHHRGTTEEKSLAINLGPCCGGCIRLLWLAERTEQEGV